MTLNFASQSPTQFNDFTSNNFSVIMNDQFGDKQNVIDLLFLKKGAKI